LVIIPQLLIFQIPFETLPLRDGSPLLTRFVVAVEPSVAVLAQLSGNVTGPGTYTFGFGQNGEARFCVGGSIDNCLQSWSSILTGGGGTLVGTAISSSQASGTFSVHGPSASGAGINTITNGSFTVRS
jgi:hypothetical protein